ncbi:3-oxoacyl-ACP synthase [Fibrivirga algicola]|uniref:3-oxoacyl-ACP synthase n=1 Tax=Fibrivirga algicola TaxID=2950420 RepID=A0ABX0QI19_9BACT|nr:3-oxoacyl-ACP synthase [Fibrivirga algicola]ARK10551.1 3-oxoacyl-ACP synthase [Fibrella sp. ES10-3-2-2]NID12065.1 3-oxoacyl-ACP synthase [Fibrivirga algicola]
MLKQSIYNQCLAYVQQRIDTATEAMRAAQESANSESKSSAGDKYETGRAMAQLERDRHAQLLADAQRMKQELEHIDLAPATLVRAGSLVKTGRGTFFISISAGRISVAGDDYMAVSAASPIGAALRGKHVGDTAVFNNIQYVIEALD